MSSATIDFTIPAPLQDVLERVRAFVAEDAIGAEERIADETDLLGSWDVVEGLRDRARELGIYTPHLPEEWGGLGLGVLGMSLVNQECGVSMLASLGINAMAPDEGNMHTLLHAGTAEQNERYLRPLAEGRTRSCFAMTEPGVASSDPLNLETTAVREGEGWVLNGRKWFITGGIDAAFSIVVARTGDPQLRHKAYSLFLVPCDTPGWSVVRDPGIIGAHFAGGHPEILLEDVRVPQDALLGEEGAGFTIAQIRLAGGRLAHAMRWIGVAQRALDLTAAHMETRETFGTKLADHQGLQFFLADSAMDLYASRLMVLHTAWKVENGHPHRQEVAMTKTFVSEAFGRILDRCVQVFGSHGVATDLPIGQWYADARAARILDGASEVHRMTIARSMLRLARDGQSVKGACGDIT